MLASLSPGDRRDFHKNAAEMRKKLQSNHGHRQNDRMPVSSELESDKTDDPHELLPFREKTSIKKRFPNRPIPSIDELLFQLLKQRKVPDSPSDRGAEVQKDNARESPGIPPRVVTLGPGICQVETVDGISSYKLHRDLRCEQQTAIAIGDFVEISGNRVMSVLPRKNSLSRTEPGNQHRERVMAANIDLAVIVVSFVKPALHAGLIDRILIALEERGIPAAICANKRDLLEDEVIREKEVAKLSVFRELGFPVFSVSADKGDGVAELREYLSGKACVFLGHSGVGKSSLINVLNGRNAAPEIFDTPAIGQLETMATVGKIRSSDGRGRHTTTGSRLYRIGDDIRVIDTPGIREFGLFEMTPESILEGFPEFRGPAGNCRFRNCRHQNEPDCAVQEAVRDGRIQRIRYRRYLRILDSFEPSEQRDPFTISTGFTCLECGAKVPAATVGTTQRNHCPLCLYSRHLDYVPGDRAAACGGGMEVISVWVRKGGEWSILHRCLACGVIHANRVAGDDNEMKLLSLAVRPLSQPPFPLDRLGNIGT